ncbi:MAG: hypothetical protein RLZ56_488 [Bacteroidota bacterium]|jgi:hypothetical protein
MKINLQNFEQYCLLYIDNELSATAKQELELFIAANPQCASELALLRETVLTPTPISYPNKALLYRFQEMEASLPTSIKQKLYRSKPKVMQGFFNRPNTRYAIAIAALLMIFIGYQWIAPTTEVAKSTGQLAQQNKKLNKQSSANPSQVKATLVANTIVNTMLATHSKQTTSQEQHRENIIPTTNNPAGATVASTATTYTFATPTTPALSSKNNAPISSTQLETNLSRADVHAKNDIVNSNTIITDNSHETYEELNTEDADRTIYIANLEIDGDKLRGFGRRFNALLKRNKTEKEK